MHINPTPVVRAAEMADAERLAIMHLAAWRETYVGLLPQRLIESRSMGERIARWETLLHLRSTPGAEMVYLAECSEGILGFVGCGKQSSIGLHERGYSGEIGSLYLLAAAQRRGLGTRLWNAANTYLAGRGHTAASLWVLRENMNARIFYERQGAQVIAEHTEEKWGLKIHDVGYGWTLCLSDMPNTTQPRLNTEPIV
jgi:ribosomal protein S18 acetylase RimI-like enzyme